MKVRTRPLLLAAALLAGTAVPLAAPAAADTGPVPLGMAGFADVVADEAHGRLFLSPGRLGAGLRVTDLQGGSSSTLTALPGATGMALTPDGGSLWVALPGLGALKRVDTATLAVVQTIAVPTGQCPGDVAVVGDRLVYGHSCNTYSGDGGYGGIGVVDVSTGTVLGGTNTGPFLRPVVATGPAGQVYAADSRVSPTGLYLYDVTGPAPALVAARSQVCSNLRDLSAAPDGSRVVTACGGTYQHSVYSSAKLDLAGSYPSGAYPLAGVWSGDGRTFVAGIDSAYEPDVYVYRGGASAPVRIVDFGSTTALLQPRGLAVSADGLRVWAVTGSATSGDLAVRVLDVPAPDAASLTLAASPTAMYPGSSTTVSGRLAAATGAPLAGQVLRVVRGATGQSPVQLTNVTTDADGHFAFTDAPPVSGSYVYSVSRGADGARAEVPVLVWRTEPTLLLDLTRSAVGGAPVQGTLRLYYNGPTSTAGRTISLVRVGGGLQVPLPSVVTDAQGAASFTDAPPAGDWTYTATVAANGIHPSGSTSASTTVLTATTLTARVAETATAGTPLTVNGVLTTPSGPVTGAVVVVTRAGCGTSWTGSATTTPNGAWSVNDPNPPSGSCTYRASYAGGNGYDSSTASVSTSVTARPTVLTTVVPGSPLAGPVAVTGRMTSAGAAVPGAAVHLSRSGCSSWTGSVTTGADGSWSLTDPSVPAGSCTWTASFRGDPTYGASTASATAQVAKQTSSLELSIVRGTGSAKKQVFVTAQLTGGSASNRTVTITARPAGGTEVILVSAAVDSTGKLTATYTPRTTTTYRATYAGDAYSSPAAAERTP